MRNAVTLASELEAHGYGIVTGGTENHQVLVDVTSRNLDGQQAERILEQVGIIANRNVIPQDVAVPGRVSGVRLGSGAVAARGMGTEEMVNIAALIDEAWRHAGHNHGLERIAAQVVALCRLFPVYRQ